MDKSVGTLYSGQLNSIYSMQLNACDPYFWRTILIFGKAQKVTKTASPGHKNDFFHQNYFFSRVHTLDSCFLQKTALILVKYSLQSPV